MEEAFTRTPNRVSTLSLAFHGFNYPGVRLEKTKSSKRQPVKFASKLGHKGTEQVDFAQCRDSSKIEPGSFSELWWPQKSDKTLRRKYLYSANGICPNRRGHAMFCLSPPLMLSQSFSYCRMMRWYSCELRKWGIVP